MENVAYLEATDIDSNGNLKPYVGKGKPVVLMAQGQFCGYCQQAKPAFVDFAKEHKGVTAACIEIDGDPSEREAAKWLNRWDKKYMGVPMYCIFDNNGRYVRTHSGGRDKGSLMMFASSLN